jgi:hypothetical protein
MTLIQLIETFIRLNRTQGRKTAETWIDNCCDPDVAEAVKRTVSKDGFLLRVGNNSKIVIDTDNSFDGSPDTKNSVAPTK